MNKDNKNKEQSMEENYNGDAGAFSMSETAVEEKSKKTKTGLFLIPKISKIILYVYLALLPIFFLPLTASPIWLNKEFFAVLALSAVSILWLAKTISDGKIVWRKSLLNVAILVILAVVAVSTIFSVSPWVSVFGLENQTDTLTGFLVYALTFFLMGQFFTSLEDAKKGFFYMGGAFLAASLLFLAGTMKIFVFPFDFAQNAAFNTIGTVNAASLYFALGVLWGVVFWFDSKTTGRKVFSAAAITAGYVSLILINFKTSFVALAIALLLFLMMRAFEGGASSVRKLVLPMVLLVASFVMSLGAADSLFFLLRQKAGLNITEISPSANITVVATKDVLTSGVGRLFIGSGPGTFVYEWQKVRPLELNNTNFWGVRFNQGFSGLFTQVLQLGILGALAFLGLIAGLALMGVALFVWAKKKKLAEDGDVFIGVFCATVFVLFCWIAYPFVFSLNILFFAFLAFTAILYSEIKKEKMLSARADKEVVESEIYRTFDFMSSPQKTLIVTLVLITLITFSVPFVYFEAQRYVGALHFDKGNKALQAGNLNIAFTEAEKAMIADKYRDTYFRLFSQVNISKINELATVGGANQQEVLNSFSVYSSNALDAARTATSLNERDPFNWAMLGVVYEGLIPFGVQNSGEFSQTAYKQAFEYDSKSPLRAMDIGRAYMLSADQLAGMIVSSEQSAEKNAATIAQANQKKEEYLRNSMEWLNKSIELKANYGPAHFLLAQVYDRQGKIKEAVAKVEQLRLAAGEDVGLMFQLGFLYYKDNQFDKAQKEFEAAVLLSPNYSNARYFLGLIYDKKGMKTNATQQFERILQLNPNNAEIKQILSNLKNGSGALNSVPPPPPEQRIEAPIKNESVEGQPVQSIFDTPELPLNQ